MAIGSECLQQMSESSHGPMPARARMPRNGAESRGTAFPRPTVRRSIRLMPKLCRSFGVRSFVCSGLFVPNLERAFILGLAIDCSEHNPMSGTLDASAISRLTDTELSKAIASCTKTSALLRVECGKRSQKKAKAEQHNLLRRLLQTYAPSEKGATQFSAAVESLVKCAGRSNGRLRETREALASVRACFDGPTPAIVTALINELRNSPLDAPEASEAYFDVALLGDLQHLHGRVHIETLREISEASGTLVDLYNTLRSEAAPRRPAAIDRLLQERIGVHLDKDALENLQLGTADFLECARSLRAFLCKKTKAFPSGISERTFCLLAATNHDPDSLSRELKGQITGHGQNNLEWWHHNLRRRIASLTLKETALLASCVDSE